MALNSTVSYRNSPGAGAGIQGFLPSWVPLSCCPYGPRKFYLRLPSWAASTRGMALTTGLFGLRWLGSPSPVCYMNDLTDAVPPLQKKT